MKTQRPACFARSSLPKWRRRNTAGSLSPHRGHTGAVSRPRLEETGWVQPWFSSVADPQEIDLFTPDVEPGTTPPAISRSGASYPGDIAGSRSLTCLVLWPHPVGLGASHQSLRPRGSPTRSSSRTDDPSAVDWPQTIRGHDAALGRKRLVRHSPVGTGRPSGCLPHGPLQRSSRELGERNPALADRILEIGNTREDRRLQFAEKER